MMGVIAQITTAVIALVLTLVAAYMIFLSTYQANIEAEVQLEGAKVVEVLRKSPTQRVQIPYLEMFLRQHYQQKHPELSGANLLYRITFDTHLSKGHGPPPKKRTHAGSHAQKFASRRNFAEPLPKDLLASFAGKS